MFKSHHIALAHPSQQMLCKSSANDKQVFVKFLDNIRQRLSKHSASAQQTLSKQSAITQQTLNKRPAFLYLKAKAYWHFLLLQKNQRRAIILSSTYVCRVFRNKSMFFIKGNLNNPISLCLTFSSSYTNFEKVSNQWKDPYLDKGGSF